MGRANGRRGSPSLWWLRRALAESHSAIHSGVNSSFFRGTASANLAAPLLSRSSSPGTGGFLPLISGITGGALYEPLHAYATCWPAVSYASLSNA